MSHGEAVHGDALHPDAPASDRAAGAATRGALDVAVVGVSVHGVCGVHDHAVTLAEELDHEDVSHSLHWLRRGRGSVWDARSEFRSWARTLSAELDSERPDAIVLHYSVFSFSHRGVPIFVRPVLSALRSLDIPVMVVLHEFAYPWRYGGWQGDVWALTQRLALIEVMRASVGAIVTTDFRQHWLTSRRWLPRRPVAFAPVFSNLPAPGTAPQRAREQRPVLGLFGYSYEGAELTMVLDAIRLLVERGVEVELALLGGTGRSSSAGEAWLAAARGREIEHLLSFSGTLPAQELSDALAACDVLLSAFAPGPSSRKGTLAGSIASGSPVIAIDGPRGWAELIESDAIRVVAPNAQAVADTVAELLGDQQSRAALGARGRAFAEQRMGVGRTAQALTALLEDTLARQSGLTSH
jgi:glycosyltransferase involved in cell wall biosynthesis